MAEQLQLQYILEQSCTDSICVAYFVCVYFLFCCMVMGGLTNERHTIESLYSKGWEWSEDGLQDKNDDPNKHRN